jgi:nucleoid-associated protein YgaU
MTERGSAPVERAAACPFVAFEDDRDERSERPDHRHRCYAELRPAPRAIAHQEAYCLSAGFPACPTFQDWARREAARARRTGETGVDDAASGLAAAGVADAGTTDASIEPAGAVAGGDRGTPVEASEERPSKPMAEDAPPYRPRPANRKWASPPPWAAGAAGAGSAAGAAGAASAAAAGASTSAAGAPPEASGLAASRWLDDGSSSAARPATASGVDTPAFLADRGADTNEDDAPGQELAAVVPRSRRPIGNDRSARAGAAAERPPARPPVIGQARPVSRAEHDDGTPSWERPRRFEAYPTLKRRVGMPAMSRLTIGVIALVVAALLLFTLPWLFLGGASQETTATPTPTASSAASTGPSVPAAPTPVTYTVKPGDTLARIATKYGVTQKQILAANPEIKDPDKIVVGQVIIIPTATPPDVIESGPSGSPPPSG